MSWRFHARTPPEGCKSRKCALQDDQSSCDATTGPQELRSASLARGRGGRRGAARADAPPLRSDHPASAANAAICSEMG
eukprot:847623-Prymnesium_polylepis.1